MLEALSSVKSAFVMYFNNSKILYIYLLSLVVLCLCGREKRKTIVYPSLLLFFIIANPVLYKFVWLKLIGGTYWRMIWMIPVVPTIALSVISIIDFVNRRLSSKLAGNVSAIAMLGIFLTVIILSNSRIYSKGTHVPVKNMFKVPDNTVSVCNVLLEAEEGNRVDVVMPATMYCYTRQFSDKIHQMYGRDVEHYMAYSLLTEDEKKVAGELLSECPNMEFVTTIAKNNGYKYIVCEPYSVIDDAKMRDYGYELYRNEVGYRIYRLV